MTEKRSVSAEENKDAQKADMDIKRENAAAKAGSEKDPRSRLYKSERITIIASSPHAKGKNSVQRIMYTVILALLPAVVMSSLFFGTRALAVMAVSIIAAVIAESICNRVMKKEFTINDGSAILTGLLLAMTLPPSFPLTLTALGSAVAVVFGKQVFGGLGANIFNPALIGRAFLQASFPVKMTTWTLPSFAGTEAVSGATPLTLMKYEGLETQLWPLITGNIGGCIGETSAMALIAGGLLLLILKYADWRIPLSYIGTVFLFSGLLWVISPDAYPDPFFMIFSGGLMLGAFFMATDMVSSPVTSPGTWIYGIGMGVILVVIRIWGGLPEAVMYSILLMNGLAPLINRWTRPKYFGEIHEEMKK